ncbi:MAG: hypothetical protein P4N41_11970 [Negativicutes bacterium]|nr:hypothetical protein [Negativicutes bacterium]
MKRLVSLLLIVCLLVITAPTTFAERSGHDRYRGHTDSGDRHIQREGRHDERMPFRWGDHRSEFRSHRLDAIHDRGLEHRFPGLRGYRWRGYGDEGRGFWHNGHYVNDAVVFFDGDDRMAGYGYLSHGRFISVREDGCSEDRDAFFLFLGLLSILGSRD